MYNETPVSSDYQERDNKFSGTIKRITVDVKPINLCAHDKKQIGDKEEMREIAED